MYCFDSYSVIVYMKMLLNHTCFFVLGGEIPNINVAEGKQLLGI